MADNPQRLSRSGSRVAVSFEFFPPKTAEMEAQLWEAIGRLAPLAPEFVSVTYGAGGSTRERTHATVARLVKETPLKPAAHLTCVGASCSRNRRGGARLRRRRRPPHRRSARRSARRPRHALCRAARRLPVDRRSGGGDQGGGRFRSLGLRLSGEAPAEPELCCTTSRRSSARSTRAPTAPSPSSSSTTAPISASSTSPRRRGSRSRSCRESCRC